MRRSVTSGAELRERELAAWRGMLRVHSRTVAKLDAELDREHGLSLSSYEVLLNLADAPAREMRMGELAELLLLSRSGLTRLVDRLCREGLLERVNCEDDRRGSYARLTAAGLARFKSARPSHLRGVREHFLSRLPTAQQEALGTAFDRILQGAGEDVPGGLAKKPLPPGTSSPRPEPEGDL